MEESVLLNNPVVLVSFIIALCLCIVSLTKKESKVIAVISVVVFTSALTYALLKGMELYEAGAAATVFFIIRLTAIRKTGDKE